MPKIFRKSAILCKQEATQNTPVVPGPTDALWVSELNIEPVVEKEERDYHRPYLDQIPYMPGTKSVNLTFTTELKGGALGTGTGNAVAFPALSAVLESGPMLGAFVGADVVFYPTSTASSANYTGPGKSMTVQVYKDGLLHTVAGVQGSFKITAEAGKIAKLEYSGKGLASEASDSSFTNAMTTPNPALPPVVTNADFWILNHKPVASKFDFDISAEVTPRMDVNSTSGFTGFMITKYAAKGSVNPEVPTVASYNFFNALNNGTTGCLSATIGTVAGNKVEIYMPCVQIDSLKYGDHAGTLVFDTTFRANAISGNDSFHLVLK